MKYLLDTAVFLWTCLDMREKISPKATAVLETSSSLFLSSASVWEIAIKHSIGKLGLKGDPKEWLPDAVLKMGLKQLPVTHRHALDVAHLPNHHKDPFDRLLISQSRIEKMTLLTPDLMIKKYRVQVLW